MKKKKINYYFAHNFNNRKEFRKLELELEKELNIKLFNPFYDDPTRIEEMAELDAREYDDVKRLQQLQKKVFENRFNTDDADADLIVRRDLTNLAKQDALFTICIKPSFGTAIEICNAVLMRKEIYFVSKIYVDHPWIKKYTDYRFRTVEEFKKFIKENTECPNKEEPVKYICNKGYACDACPYNEDLQKKGKNNGKI